ncbi:ABC transporter substrate-binding protein [Pseudosulfitobacter sp. DSM 107133]|uniref:heme/hemin ABC transporter substrate-binding protein n=1 Tax=Pseudosulfitobacter sp. DSM 107133 TaxID=2883100 RepID=UPI000DF23AE2|nr:ABC transporter substrate-binding protein [Pseudosulfitobacter sp. DSM 107133]UOA27832.1 Hemin-binding periplasmic protein HmuT [Pseudosulfitobacter sp. DSM 107133]
MKRRSLMLGLVTLALPLGALAQPYDTSRVVAIGGATTEIVYALGAADKLVARDSTSTFPARAQTLPDIGYMRALAAEGVLSVQPTLILTEPGAGPPETISVLQAASVPMVVVPAPFSGEGILAKITAIGDALGMPDKAQMLSDQVRAGLDDVATQVANDDTAPKRVLFVLSTQGGRIMASGTNTAADGIIAMAGGINAIDQFEGYRQLTAEAIAVAAPDVVLMMDREGDHASTAEALFAMPEMATTPAAQTGALVKMDGLLLLGFGPRTPQAAQALHDVLQGQS